MEPSENDQNFTLGKSKKDNEHKKKKKVEDVGEDRLKQTFGIGGDSSKD